MQKKSKLKWLYPWLILILMTMTAAQFCGIWRSPLLQQNAPAFERPVMAGVGAGQASFNLTALRGEIVVLDFWASWCHPCRQSMPILNKVRALFESQPVHFVGVNVENIGVRRLRQAHRSLGAEFPSVQDSDGNIKQQYGVRALPTLVLIGPDGLVRHFKSGVPNAEDLTEEIQRLLRQP